MEMFVILLIGCLFCFRWTDRDVSYMTDNICKNGGQKNDFTANAKESGREER